MTNRLRYVPALDGLRGVAILLVLGRHAFLTPVGGGYGVDIFFVLSGFLITTLLLDEHAKSGRISIVGFYGRRARRLFPALAAMLTAFLVAEIAGGHAADGLRATAWGAFYTTNIAQAWFPHMIGRLPVGPLWSLAQEEQFYLVAPFALVLVLGRMGPRTTMLTLAGLIGVVTVEGWALTLTGAGTERIYAGPDTHSGGLLVGMLLAFGLRNAPSTGAARIDWKLGPFALVLLVPLVLGLWAPFAFQAPLVYIAAAGLVCCAICQPSSVVSRLLSSRPIVFIGRISYSLYLWHVLMLWLFGWHDRGAALGVAFLVAYASYRFVEQPFRRRRPRTQSPAAAIPAT